MHKEKFLKLAAAVEAATGHRVHPTTVTRWCLKANRYGNVLESWMIGGRRVTSVEAVHRYNAANNKQSLASDLPEAASSIANSETHSKAMQDLESEGL